MQFWTTLRYIDFYSMALEQITYRFPTSPNGDPLKDNTTTIYFSGLPLGKSLGSQNLFWGEKSEGNKHSNTIVIKKVGHPLLANAEKNILGIVHPHIISYEWFVYTSYGISFFCMPVYDGDLWNFILEKNPSKTLILSFFDQMKKAVGYIHSIGLIHRDIKLENFLVKMMDNGIHIVLADFGFSRKISGEKDPIYSSRFGDGTALYMAPELIVREKYPHKAPDYWAMGVCFYYMLYRKFPFMGTDKFEVFGQIKTMQYRELPIDAPEEEKEFFSNTFCHFEKRKCSYE